MPGAHDYRTQSGGGSGRGWTHPATKVQCIERRTCALYCEDECLSCKHNDKATAKKKKDHYTTR